MKKVAMLLVGFMVLGSAVSFAGHHGGHSKCEKSVEKQEEYIEKKVKKMSKAFDLSEGQEAQVETILRDKMDKKHVAKQNYKDAKAKISEEFRSKMNGVLTAEQKPAFDKMLAKYDSKKCHGCSGKCGKKKRFLFF